MKRLIVVLSVILSLFFIIGCGGGCGPWPEPTYSFYVGFDIKKNPFPLSVDIEIDNKLSEEISVNLGYVILGEWYDYKDIFNNKTPYELQLSSICLNPFSNNLNLKAGETQEIKNISLMNSEMSEKLSRFVHSHSNVNYAKEDFKTVLPGVSSFYLSGIGDSDYYSAGDIDYQFGKDVWELTAEDFEALGGDFYYILDPEKSGTTSFGHVVSSDDNLKGKESGHVKIKLTIKDDPENEGKRLVEFAYLGEVTEGE